MAIGCIFSKADIRSLSKREKHKTSTSAVTWRGLFPPPPLLKSAYSTLCRPFHATFLGGPFRGCEHVSYTDGLRLGMSDRRQVTGGKRVPLRIHRELPPLRNRSPSLISADEFPQVRLAHRHGTSPRFHLGTLLARILSIPATCLAT